jgi:hypothetical protein
VYLAFAMLLLALAAFSLLAGRLAQGPVADRSAGSEQLRGFLFVGATALVALAFGVLGVGLLGDRTGRAEGLALFGFFTYAIYLLAAFVIVHLSAQR